MVMRKNDNYKSIVGCVTVNVLTRKRGSNLTCGAGSVFVHKSIPHHLPTCEKRLPNELVRQSLSKVWCQRESNQ